MPAILIICNDEPFRNAVREAVTPANATAVGVPNTREILTQRSARQISGYDLIVAEVESRDHDGLSRLILFRNLYPNTPFIAITREEPAIGQAFSGAAARALKAWLAPTHAGMLDELTKVAKRALTGEEPALASASNL